MPARKKKSTRPLKQKNQSAFLGSALSFFRTLAEESPFVIWFKDTDGVYTFVNDRFAQTHGFEKASDILGKTDHDLHTAAVARRVIEEDHIVFAKKRILKLERPDLAGRRGDYAITKIPVVNEKNQILGLVGIASDESSQKRSAKIHQALYNISQAVNTVENLNELFRVIHRIIGSLMPAKNFYIALYDADSKQISFPYFADQYDQPPASRQAGRGLTEYVLRSGEPLLANPDVVQDLVHAGEVERLGTESLDWLGVPLIAKNVPVGILVVQSYHDEGIRYGETEKQLLTFVSEQIAMAIEHRRAQDRLQMSESDYRGLFEHARDAIFLFEPDHEIVLEANEQACLTYGYSREELIGMSLEKISTNIPRGKELVRQTLQQSKSAHFETVQRCKDGSLIHIDTVASVVEYKGKAAILSINRNITERKRMEMHLIQAQKMESLGRIAGGIAHDINNILAVIIPSAEMIRQDAGPKVEQDTDMILNAARRGAQMVSQLLLFARQSPVDLNLFELHQLISETTTLLRRLIDANISIHLKPFEGPAWIKGDSGQLQQVIMNLALNARDAMPQGGQLTFETRQVELRETEIGNRRQMEPGPHIQLSVRDTGSGIATDSMDKIFDAFYTTKEIGKGTGLGLAVANSIIVNHRGHIDVHSVPGKGSEFRILLPASSEAVSYDAIPNRKYLRGDGSVLVVDDDDQVLTVCKETLGKLGYEVSTAGLPSEALELFGRKQFDLVMIDIQMPERDGTELAAELLLLEQGIHILFMTGFTTKEKIDWITNRLRLPYIFKPFTIHQLATAVRLAMG